MNKRNELIHKCENVEELMSIHDTEDLVEIWKKFPNKQWNEKLLNYFFDEIDSMLKGSFRRSFIDEQIFHQFLISNLFDEQTTNNFNRLFQLMKKLNSKLIAQSYPSYIPHPGKILQRFIRENRQQIEEFTPINDEFVYHLLLSLILSNNYSSDYLSFNQLVEIHSLLNIQLTNKQICHLIHSCLMCQNSEICLKFIQYLLNIPTKTNESMNYVMEYLAILIRSTVYEIEEINRRFRLRKNLLIQNGETIFDLRAKLFIPTKSHESVSEQFSLSPQMSKRILGRNRNKYR